MNSIRSRWGRRVVLSALFVFIATLSPTVNGEASGPLKVTLRLVPEGAAPSRNAVELSFWEQQWKPELSLVLPEPGKTASLPEGEFLARVIAVNARGTIDEVLALWNAPEREDVRAMVADDPEVFTLNQGYFRRIASSTLVKEVFYGDYRLLFVRHTSASADLKEHVKVYPIKQIGDAYFMTNALQADPVFQYFSEAMKDALENATTSTQ